jgi:uncharacterized protein (TIGR03437 family)
MRPWINQHWLRDPLRLAVGVWLAAHLAQGANLVRGPYLQNVGRNRATVMWAALDSGSGVVEYSRDRSFSSRASARVRRFDPTSTGYAVAYFQYEAELTGLEAGTEYNYRVRLNGEDLDPAESLRFRTAGAGPVAFLAFGDSGSGSEGQLSLARRILQEKVDLVVHTGDLAYPHGTFQEFDDFYFRVYGALMRQAPFFPCLGNHEYYTDGAFPYLSLHSLPSDGVPAAGLNRYYSFDWSNVHLVSLDSSMSLEVPQTARYMLDWLENDLRQTRQLWKIVYFHVPPYAFGVHDTEPGMQTVREQIVPILERHGVQLVLNGHEHSYQRSFPIRNGAAVAPGQGIVYVTTGGGGGCLHTVLADALVAAAAFAYHYVRVDVEGDRLTLRAIRTDGYEMDRLTLQARSNTVITGVVNAASLTPGLAPGALVHINGLGLAPEDKAPTNFPLPTDLSGVGVTVEGKPLPLFSICDTRIQAQLPFDLSGRAALKVWTPAGFAETSVLIADSAPSIFPNSVVGPSGAVVTDAAPAEPGFWLVVYLTGLGRVAGDIAPGQETPCSPLIPTRLPVTVQLGDLTVAPIFAGLTPGFAGVYQVNFQVPPGIAAGRHALRVVTGGASSNAVSLPVASRK